MRLIATFENGEEGQKLSSFLKLEKIENDLEIALNKDGSIKNISLWIVNEEDVPRAIEFFNRFKSTPEDPQFSPNPIFEVKPDPLPKKRATKNKFTPFFPYVNFIFLGICVLLFAIQGITTPTAIKNNAFSETASFIESPVNKAFLFDYPEGYEILGSLIKGYGVKALEDPKEATPNEKILLEKFNRTPVFQGIYQALLQDYKSPGSVPLINAPLFEKIKEGQVWRFFSPIFLHGDLIHIFFNMIWLLALGSQIERRFGPFKYLFFVLLTAAISNTAQYLMGGPNFVGFSGVLFAFATFIWFAQKQDITETLLLDRKTMRWLLGFLCVLIVLQVLSFFLEAHADLGLNIGIANTAHIVGALSGILLAKLRIFQ